MSDVDANQHGYMNMQMEVGKYYKTRDGRKVGPMKKAYSDSFSDSFISDLDGQSRVFMHDGEHCFGFANYDLIAEWQDEPAPHVYKVGDKVRIVDETGGHGFSCGDVVTIVGYDIYDKAYGASFGKDIWLVWDNEIEPYTTSDTPTLTASKTWQDIHAAIKQMLIDRAYLAIENDDDLVAIRSMQKLQELEEINPAQ